MARKKHKCDCGTEVFLNESVAKDFLVGVCRVCRKKHIFAVDDDAVINMPDAEENVNSVSNGLPLNQQPKEENNANTDSSEKE